MSILAFTILLGLGSFAAGLLGALTGLGGGVVIVPLLVLVFGVDLPDAVGTSLVAVIATSSGAAAAYVREGYSNIRIGMVLEVATTIGAVAGALLALVIAPGIISIIFGVALLISAYLSARQRPWRPGRRGPIGWPSTCGSVAAFPRRKARERITSSACPWALR